MATYYISPSGTDSGPGGIGAPWQTVAYAFTNSASGDTIIALNGTYPLVNQSFNSNRNIQALNTNLAIFDGSNTAKVWRITNNTTITITGIKFINIINGSGITHGFLGVDTGSCVANLVNCIFKNIKVNLQAGVISIRDTCVSTFTNCLFDDIISTNSASDQYAIFCGDGSAANAIALVNCVISCRTSGATQLGFIVRNLGSMGWTVKNTIVSNVTGGTVTWTGLAPSPQTVSYSDLYLITTPPTNTNGISSAPLFIDESNSNFNLRPTSPCIDIGIVP